MNKTELTDAVAKVSKLSKADSKKAIDAVLEVFSKTLKKGEPIQLIGFGTFKVADRKARTGRNPSTGEEIKIPASKAVTFSAGQNLKDLVNKRKK